MSIKSASVITMPLLSRAAASRQPVPPVTFADLAERIKADGSLTPARRRDALSALATMARAMRRDLKDVPAHAGFIREQLKGFAPSMLNPRVSMGRWRNVRSLVNRAMEEAGIPTTQGPYRAAIAPEWQVQLAKLDKMRRFELSPLARSCTAEGIAPDGVDDEVLARFHAHLKQT